MRLRYKVVQSVFCSQKMKEMSSEFGHRQLGLQIFQYSISWFLKLDSTVNPHFIWYSYLQFCVNLLKYRHPLLFFRLKFLTANSFIRISKLVKNDIFLVKNGLFSSQKWTFFCEFKICGPKWRNVSTENNEEKAVLRFQRNVTTSKLPMALVSRYANLRTIFLCFKFLGLGQYSKGKL